MELIMAVGGKKKPRSCMEENILNMWSFAGSSILFLLSSSGLGSVVQFLILSELVKT